MFNNFKRSANMLKNTRVLCCSAILTAMYVVLYIFQLPLTPQSRISFTFVPTALAGWLFGPVPAMISGALGDIISTLVHPTGAYFPGFTVTSALCGLVYGLCLFGRGKKQHVFGFIILAAFIITVFLNTLLNTFWISILYKKAFWVFFAGRLVKNIILLPVEIAVLILIISILDKSRIRKNV